MERYFISDAHLGCDTEPAEQKKQAALIRFIEHIDVAGNTLYIVGDLFDFWFEYRSSIPRKYFPVICALRHLIENGVEVVYITGNHDFWMDSFFENDLHISVYRGSLHTEIDGRRIFIVHGDGLAQKDIGYRILKRILQHPLNIFLYRLLHPDLGFAIAGFFSRWSRHHCEMKIRDAEYIAYAKARFADGFDGVIIGHTHRPQVFREGQKTYINTGDWMTHFTYGKMKNGRLSLETWPTTESEEQGILSKKSKERIEASSPSKAWGST